MTTIVELGQAVHTRRSDMGLTQTYLAELTGLSRQTINQIEKGTIKDLSLNRAERLANALGLSLQVAGHGSARLRDATAGLKPLVRAARASSVSYRGQLDPDQLRDILLGSSPPIEVFPYLVALLDEAPVSLLASVVEQLHAEAAVGHAKVWKRMGDLALQLNSRRDIWQ